MDQKDQKELAKKKCIPCEGKGIKPFTKEEAEDYLTQTAGWHLSEDSRKISKEYKFQDFLGAVNFVNYVAEIAEEQGHHPDITINYNKVTLELSTHAVGGLSENDFILVANIDSRRS
ncbi:4a-hydroxytetrahydrobiopterin dehydratase [Patescibacteria group bacterium]|nr:4a-hydroxytetrahydrobiopterin dehydratase [Patescibacteria group bacterium]